MVSGTTRRAAARLCALATLVVILCAFPLSAAAGPADQSAGPADWDIANGHFFTQTRGNAPATAGYTVTDDASARFWSEFQRLGGVNVVGYPISRRFTWGGYLCQAFQKAVLQWRPDRGQVVFTNVFDELTAHGKDAWLDGNRFVPHPATFDEKGMTWPQIVADRLKVLDAAPDIKKAFLAVPDWLDLNGLPESVVTDYPNVRVLRAQRVVIQQWKIDTPWAAKGQVVFANGGDLAKEVGLFPNDVYALEQQTSPVAASAPQVSQDPPEQADAALTAQIQQVVAGLQGTYGVAAYNFTTGQSVRINDAQEFRAASLYKLIGMYEVYRQSKDGRFDINGQIQITSDDVVDDPSALNPGDVDSVKDVMRLMITVSSNTAAHALFNRLGWATFDQAAHELGMNETHLAEPSAPLNYWQHYEQSTSPRDMLRFFQLLGRRQLVDAASSDAMIALLLDQQINDRIPMGLPPGIRVAHKTGDLDGVRNDAGIVYGAKGPYILAVLSLNADPDQATNAIIAITRLVQARYG